MTYRPGWWRRMTSLWRQDELDRGLDDELAFHIEQQTAKNIGLGMPPDEGYFRIVFLAAPETLHAVFDDMTAFTHDFLAR